MGVLGVLLGDEDTGILIRKLVRESQKAVSISIDLLDVQRTWLFCNRCHTISRSFY